MSTKSLPWADPLTQKVDRIAKMVKPGENSNFSKERALLHNFLSKVNTSNIECYQEWGLTIHEETLN